jgi:hypothetical protein
VLSSSQCTYVRSDGYSRVSQTPRALTRGLSRPHYVELRRLHQEGPDRVEGILDALCAEVQREDVDELCLSKPPCPRPQGQARLAVPRQEAAEAKKKGIERWMCPWAAWKPSPQYTVNSTSRCYRPSAVWQRGKPAGLSRQCGAGSLEDLKREMAP